ncbi:caspase family protein [Terrabacter sp. Ter38]|uniref:caspase family protein n=1 Tax=Terrabacter sp. Ter38 TaxID=2926030 RepID=UPI0021188C08|nr:caspase family protein [Terrabacter sp. Ter38]
MTRSALCVGINEFASLPETAWLRGCVNDAHDMAGSLTALHFVASDIVVLSDRKATKEAVWSRLTRLVSASRPGDTVVFSISTHGVQVPNLPGDVDDEPDGLDEALACADLRAGADGWDRDTIILDDELRDLMGSVPRGVLLEVLLDTCHSGTGLRDVEGPAGSGAGGPAQGRPRFLPSPVQTGLARRLAPAAPRREADARRRPYRSVPLRAVVHSACRPDQTARDATFDGRPNGAFTHVFLDELTRDPGRSRRALTSAVSTALKEQGFSQSSMLEGPKSAGRGAFLYPW